MNTMPVAIIFEKVICKSLSSPITVTNRYIRIRLKTRPIALTRNIRKISFPASPLYFLLSLNVIILPRNQFAVVERMKASTVAIRYGILQTDEKMKNITHSTIAAIPPTQKYEMNCLINCFENIFDIPVNRLPFQNL